MQIFPINCFIDKSGKQECLPLYNYANTISLMLNDNVTHGNYIYLKRKEIIMQM
jgi:hypothetical protein